MISLTKRLLALSAISALSFGMMACDDDADSSGQSNNTNNQNTGDQTGSKECTTLNSFKCDNNSVMQCVANNGKNEYTQIKACGTDELCNAETGNCDKLCTLNDVKCSGNSLMKCQESGGKREFVQIKACGTDETCNESAADCSKNVDVSVSNSIIGRTCECKGNCTIEITGKELKEIFSDEGKAFIKTFNIDIDTIADDEKITAPNYFPGESNITGCEGLVVPDGMTMGCLTDAKIQFPPTVVNFVKGMSTKVSGILNNQFVSAAISALAKDKKIDAADIANKINGVGGLLENGISFKAKNGYCLVATIDIGEKLEAYSLTLLGTKDKDYIAKDPLNKETGLVKKINTGDHSKVVAGSEAALTAGTNYCPEGSVLFSYTVPPIDFSNNLVVGIKTSIKVGFDMCLKACENNSDCRENDGYSCVEIPNGVPAKGTPEAEIKKTKACFDKANIDYFTKITNDFAPAKDAAAGN